MWMGDGVEQCQRVLLHERDLSGQENRGRRLPSLQRDGEKTMSDVVRKTVELPNGTHVTMFSLLEDRYRIWCDLQGFYRWSITQWPDDGVGGVPSHGKSMSLRGAIKSCEKNDAFRKEIYA